MALTSPFANLFDKLVTQISNVSGIRYVNQDWNQLDHENPPVSYPCVLIDFPETKFDQHQGFQKGTVTVRLKLIYKSFSDMGNLVSNTVQETALQFYELEQAVYEALQAWYADSLLCDAMIRQTAATEKRDDGLRVRVMEFQCGFNDSTVTG